MLPDLNFKVFQPLHFLHTSNSQTTRRFRLPWSSIVSVDGFLKLKSSWKREKRWKRNEIKMKKEKEFSRVLYNTIIFFGNMKMSKTLFLSSFRKFNQQRNYKKKSLLLVVFRINISLPFNCWSKTIDFLIVYFTNNSRLWRLTAVVENTEISDHQH